MGSLCLQVANNSLIEVVVEFDIKIRTSAFWFPVTTTMSQSKTISFNNPDGGDSSGKPVRSVGTCRSLLNRRRPLGRCNGQAKNRTEPRLLSVDLDGIEFPSLNIGAQVYSVWAMYFNHTGALSACSFCIEARGCCLVEQKFLSTRLCPSCSPSPGRLHCSSSQRSTDTACWEQIPRPAACQRANQPCGSHPDYQRLVS
mgnify:CR=1 FL=1